MIEIEISDQLHEAVEKLHRSIATHVQSAPVRETFKNSLLWEGVVHVFDLAGHPIATRAYAWSSLVQGSPSDDSSRYYISRQSIARRLRCEPRSSRA